MSQVLVSKGTGRWSHVLLPGRIKKQRRDLAVKKLYENFNALHRFIVTLAHDKASQEKVMEKTVYEADDKYLEMLEAEDPESWLREIAKRKITQYYKPRRFHNWLTDEGGEEITDEAFWEDRTIMTDTIVNHSELIKHLADIRVEYLRVFLAIHCCMLSVPRLAKMWNVDERIVTSYYKRAVRAVKIEVLEALERNEK